MNTAFRIFLLALIYGMSITAFAGDKSPYKAMYLTELQIHSCL